MDLTNVTNENQVTQHLRKALTFAYKKMSRTEIFIQLKVSGKRNNPDVEITPIIKHAVNEIDNDKVVSVSKLDYTDYVVNNKTGWVLWIYLYKRKYQSPPIKVEDKPITKEYGRKDHKVSYSVVLYNKKQIRLYQIIYHIFKKISEFQLMKWY